MWVSSLDGEIETLRMVLLDRYLVHSVLSSLIPFDN
jgi:hypothetical protein